MRSAELDQLLALGTGSATATTPPPYPFGTYAAAWGTSFSAPQVSGGVCLLKSLQLGLTRLPAKVDTAHAVLFWP